MPQVFKVGSYWVYFWTNEGDPLEPIHVHISEGSPSPNATKVWITKSGKCLLCSRTSRIPDEVFQFAAVQSDEIVHFPDPVVQC